MLRLDKNTVYSSLRAFNGVASFVLAAAPASSLDFDGEGVLTDVALTFCGGVSVPPDEIESAEIATIAIFRNVTII